MRLVVDATVLVGELTRRRGRELIERPDLMLAVTERAWDEARHELRKRVRAIARRRGVVPATDEHLLATALSLVDTRVTLEPLSLYASFERIARARIPRDPDDWPTVALALALDAAIWTHDHDFLGCGVATWTPETLLARLAD